MSAPVSSLFFVKYIERRKEIILKFREFFLFCSIFLAIGFANDFKLFWSDEVKTALMYFKIGTNKIRPLSQKAESGTALVATTLSFDFLIVQWLLIWSSHV